MSLVEAIILGIIQGFTEFFPVSSSGHLALGQMFFGLHDLHNFIFFDVVLHLGTLLAIITVFGPEIRNIFARERQKLLIIGIGTLPLVPLTLAIGTIKDLLANVHILGFCFLTTAMLLFLGERLRKTGFRPSYGFWLNPLIIGCSQALALLPGISRSGSTISTARMLGWSRKEAVEFSFLLAIPAILGSVTLELLIIITGDTTSNVAAIPPLHYLLGFTAAFVTGLIALKTLKKLAVEGRLTGFIWYCAIIGIATIIFVEVFHG